MESYAQLATVPHIPDPIQEPYDDGFRSYERHCCCHLYQAWMPAKTTSGWQAIKLWHPPENQGETKMQIARPHDDWRKEWVRGWEEARSRDRVA